MKFNSKLNIGDKLYAYAHGGGYVQELTIGQIRIKHTDSKGVRPTSGYVQGDNYKPQKEYEECYMCEETGINGGNVYTLGIHAWLTREECEIAHSEDIKHKNRLAQEELRRKEDYALREESLLLCRLEEIRKIKAKREGESVA